MIGEHCSKERMDKVKGARILAIGAHADDVEIGMGGSISKWTDEGATVIICDLTEAELSSNGTVQQRKQEAKKAAAILGVKERIGLSIPDRGLYLHESYIKEVTAVIRTYQPQIVFAPYYLDRHPDHGNCSRLVEEAFFNAGIRHYKTEGVLHAFKPNNLFYYMINGFHHPDFVIDITAYMEKKIASLHAYESQFTIGEHGVSTPLTDGYIESVSARERLFGKEVGVRYAEGFKTKKPLLLHSLIGETT